MFPMWINLEKYCDSDCQILEVKLRLWRRDFVTKYTFEICIIVYFNKTKFFSNYNGALTETMLHWLETKEFNIKISLNKKVELEGARVRTQCGGLGGISTFTCLLEIGMEVKEVRAI